MDDFDLPIQPWEEEDMRRLRRGLIERPLGGTMAAVAKPKAPPRVRCRCTNIRGGNCNCGFGQCAKGHIL